MSNSTKLKLSLIPVSAIFASLVFIPSIVSAEENPFNAIHSTSNFILAAHHGSEHGMKKMDTNSDGEVSKDEFMAHKEMKFMMMDKNGDGKLTDDEMKHKKCSHGEKKNNS